MNMTTYAEALSLDATKAGPCKPTYVLDHKEEAPSRESIRIYNL